MAFPVGVSTCTVTFGSELDVLGTAASIEGTVTPLYGGATRIVWTATGQSILNMVSGKQTAQVGSTLSFAVPHTDQAGFKDGAGNSFTGWGYRFDYTITGAGDRTTGYILFKPVVGQTTLDLDNVPDSSVGTPVGIPTVPVTSVATLTGAVSAAQIATALGKGSASGVAPLDSGSRVPEANLPAGLAAATLATTFASRTEVKLTDHTADPTGAASATTAINAAITEALTGTGKLLKPTRGTYKLDSTDRPVVIPAGGRFAIEAEPGTLFKMADAAISADNQTMFSVSAAANAEAFSVSGGAYDMNRRGQSNPVDPFEWEHCAVFRIGDANGANTSILKYVSLSHMEFIDPIADCISINRYYLDTLHIDDVKVSGRVGKRSDIEISGFPRVTKISNCSVDKIEFEPLTVPAGVTNDFLVQIDNSTAEVVLDAGGIDDPGDRVTLQVNGGRFGDLSMIRMSGYIDGATIRIPLNSLNSRRLQYLRKFTFRNCRFELEADSSGVVDPIVVSYEYTFGYSRVMFENCDFVIVPQAGYTGTFSGRALTFSQYVGTSSTFTAAGDTVNKTAHGLTQGQTVRFESLTGAAGLTAGVTYFVVGVTTNTYQVALTPGGTAIDITTDGSGTAFYLVENTVKGCRFDPRFSESFFADRCGHFAEEGNDYGGTVQSWIMSQSATTPTKFYIGQSKYHRVTSVTPWGKITAAVGGEFNIDCAVPSTRAAHVASGTFSTLPNFNNKRVIYADAAPASFGLRGDTWRLRSPVAGQTWQWICTVASAGSATWEPIPSETAERVLATVTGIDAKTTGVTTLYTVPTGKTAIITRATVRCTAASAITVAATLGIGVATNEDDIFASTTLTGLTATTKVWDFAVSGLSVKVAAAGVVKVGIDTAATGTSQTLAIDLIGYLI